MSTARATETDPLTRPAAVLGLAVAASLSAIIGVVLMASSSTLEDPTTAALRTGALAAAHIIPALYLWWRHPASRFPALMLLLALTFGVYGLVAVDAAWPYLIGRLGTFIALPLGLYVFLAFPSGRLVGRGSVAAVGAAAVLTGAGWLILSLTSPVIPTTIPSLACGADCPASPIAIGDAGAEVVPTRILFTLICAVTLWAVGLLFLHVRRTTPGLRLATALVAVTAGINGLLLVVFLMNEAFGGEALPDWFIALLGLARFGLPIVITVAVMLDQGRSARALRTLLESIAPGREAGDLRLALAGVLRDPGLVLARRRGDRWEDLAGGPVEPPGPEDARTWTEVAGEDGRPTVALLHDPALGETPAMLNAAASAAAIAIRQEDLADGLRQAVEDLRASRARLAAAADEERRRLERDLHDSAQQALVALRVRVAVARETLDGDPAAAGRTLDAIDVELGRVLDDLRRLSRGLYPPLLEDRGVVEALRGAASRAPVPIVVEGEVGRLPRQVEVAAYFCCREALQNAMKHGGPGVRVTVSLAIEDQALRFAVADDGPGFDASAPSEGTGLTGMRDRAGAVGGNLEVHSSSAGTVISGVLPLIEDAAAN